MKRRSVFLIGFVLFAVLLLSACDSKYYTSIKAKVSEERKNVYVYNDDDIKVSFMSGYREESYSLNGEHTPNIEFGIISFSILADNFTATTTPMYILLIGTKRYDGNLELNPYDNSYVADIKKVVDNNQLINAKLMVGDFIKECELKNITSEWKINSEEALKIAVNYYDSKLSSAMNGTEYLGEAYIKIINDTDFSDDDYYWYVCFIDRNKISLSVLISPETGEILAHN